MTNKHDHKVFLKQNDLAVIIGDGGGFFAKNKGLIIALVVLGVLGFAGYSFMKAKKLRRSEDFSARFYEAGQGIKKVQGYTDLIRDFGDLPAVQLARLNLADKLADDKKIEEAIKVLDEGLAQTTETGLFSTLLVMKKVGVYREQGKYAEAIKALDEGKAKLYQEFEDGARLIRADLQVVAGLKDDARKSYEELIKKGEDLAAKAKLQAEESAKSGKKTDIPERMNENILKRAKDQIYLMDLGIL